MLEQSKTVKEIKAIVFRLQNEEYGVDVQQVRSIERLEHITRVPNAPDFVKGVINLRGVVTPVIDLRKRFGLPLTSYTDQTRIIIVRIDEIEVGLIVDAANDVIDIPEEMIEAPPEIVGGVGAEYLRGVAKIGTRLLILLNLEKVLLMNEVEQLEQFEA
ncbi:chemotaxis protein CheW [Thermicanus aegyptius]|uniref:chemotaxis protein CheW n=1 Tax=Thermicanus aegyptius TaxID=94009 RepID=UPI00040EB319|nr:chemotaxis protein CheW [Thermicanus aegyptius]